MRHMLQNTATVRYPKNHTVASFDLPTQAATTFFKCMTIPFAHVVLVSDEGDPFM